MEAHGNNSCDLTLAFVLLIGFGSGVLWFFSVCGGASGASGRHGIGEVEVGNVHQTVVIVVDERVHLGALEKVLVKVEVFQVSQLEG